MKKILQRNFESNANLQNCPLCRVPIASYKDILISPPPETDVWRRRTRAQRRGPRLIRNRRRAIVMQPVEPVEPRPPWRSGETQRSPAVARQPSIERVFPVANSPTNDRTKQMYRTRRSSGFYRHQRPIR